MNIQKEWYEEAEKIEYKDLFKFINKLIKKYKHDYGTICHALAAGALATINAMNRTEQGHITGFQASGVMWKLIRKFMYKSGVLKLIDYDNMLFPQYEEQFGKYLDKETFLDLQQKAKKYLENTPAHDEVKKHWQGIVDGIVPFGYEIKEND